MKAELLGLAAAVLVGVPVARAHTAVWEWGSVGDRLGVLPCPDFLYRRGGRGAPGAGVRPGR